MKKIPTIFNRDKIKRNLVTDECNNECLWVFKGEGVAAKKLDGTCCKIESGKLYKRREVKPGKPIPPLFNEEDHDTVTGKRVGWIICDPDDKADQWHFEGLKDLDNPEDGTYELIGPKIQGNPEDVPFHILVKHSDCVEYENVPSMWDSLKEWLITRDIEGLVFHHPDGRMAKIKKKDFGLKRKINPQQKEKE